MIQLEKNEYRQFSRQPIAHDVVADVLVAGQSYPAKVVDYCAVGVGLKIDHQVLQRAQKEDLTVEVSWQQGRHTGKIAHYRVFDHSAHVGVRFYQTEQQQSISFTSEDVGWDLIEDKQILDDLFTSLVFKGPEVLVTVNQIRCSGFVIAKEMHSNDRLVVESFSITRGQIEKGIINCRFELFQTCHAFQTRVVSIEGSCYELELPKQVARLLRRETARVKNGTQNRFLNVEIYSQALGSSKGKMKVYDYGEHGLSVMDPSGWIVAPAGLQLDSIVITTSEGIKICGYGHICSHRWVSEEKQYAMGVYFETLSGKDRTNWHNTILEARYPSLSFSYNDQDHGKIWDLFERSNYMHLKGPEAYTHIIDLTRQTWTKLSSAGTQWSKRPMIRLGDEIVGHIQMDRIYPDTWCIHHLAVDPRISKTVAKELYGVTMEILLGEGGKYAMNFTEASKPWNQRSYYDFISSYRFPEHNELKRFHNYEADLSRDMKLTSFPDLEVRKANKYDLRRIGRYFEIYGSRLEREACALQHEDLELVAFNEELKRFGLERGREFFVGIHDHKFVGFARVETGTQGVNIVGILDMLYVHIMPGLGSEKDKIYETLIRAGLQRFKELGKDKVMVALDDDRNDYYVEKGLDLVCETNRWIALRDVMPRYHAFSQFLYGHLLLRKEKIRKKIHST